MVRLVVLAVIVVAGISCMQWYKGKERDAAAGALRFYGTIDIRDAKLAFSEQERIAEVLVEEGAKVKAGQELARLKTDRLRATIDQVEAEIDAQQEFVNKLEAGNRPQEIEKARAQVEAFRARSGYAQRVLERLEKTSAGGATSEQALDDARSRLVVEKAQLKANEKTLQLVLEGPRQEDIAASRSGLKALQAKLKLLLIRLSEMTLKAPADGIIQSRILEPGEMAGPGQPVFTMALTDPKWVRAYVPEPQLGRIDQGGKARVLSDSFPDQSIDGWIGFVSPVAEFTPRTVQTEDLRTSLVYEVRVFVNDSANKLRLGMPVTVIVDEKSGGSAHSNGQSAKNTTPKSS